MWAPPPFKKSLCSTSTFYLHIICNFCIKKDNEWQIECYWNSSSFYLLNVNEKIKILVWKFKMKYLLTWFIFSRFFFLYPVLQIPVNAICNHGFSDLKFVKNPSSNSIQFRIEEVSGRRENNLTGEKWSTGPGMKDLSIRPNFLP